MRIPKPSLLLLMPLTLAWASAGPPQGSALPDSEYWVYVASESEDQVSLLVWGPEGCEVRKTIDVGVRPTEIEGPHGMRVSPDGEYWYVSLAHGNPFGSVHKYRTEADSWEGSAEVGMFPATLDVASSTGLLYVANFDLHGEMIPGSISVVETDSMVEVARVEVGVMPHGSRLNRGETLQYSVMMMSGELVETDAWRFRTTRRLRLDPDDAPGVSRPTWVEPASGGERLYVALNGVGEILEVDTGQWAVTRRFRTPEGPYNLGLSADGRWLVATYRTEGSTGVWDLAGGREVARIPNTRTLPHGVVISPDSRYAFVSLEGIGGEPGAVDVIDLDAMGLVASVDVGKQASGIAFWRIAETHPVGN